MQLLCSSTGYVSFCEIVWMHDAMMSQQNASSIGSSGNALIALNTHIRPFSLKNVVQPIGVPHSTAITSSTVRCTSWLSAKCASTPRYVVTSPWFSIAITQLSSTVKWLSVCVAQIWIVSLSW